MADVRRRRSPEAPEAERELAAVARRLAVPTWALAAVVRRWEREAARRERRRRLRRQRGG